MVISPVQAQRNDIMHLIMKQLLVLTKSLSHCFHYTLLYVHADAQQNEMGGVMCKMSIEVIKRFFFSLSTCKQDGLRNNPESFFSFF